MSVTRLLAELRQRDIEVHARNGHLHCIAPPGALTADLRAALRQNRAEILAFLQQAEALAAQQPAIVPLQPRGTGIPVFAVPGHNGDVFCYRALAERLGIARPFFGLQPPGLNGKSVPLTRVEQLAAWFAEQIVSFGPTEPVVVIGFCAGGAVAIELGAQLVARGMHVRFVGLIGSPNPSYFRRGRQWTRRIAERFRQIRQHALRLRDLPCQGWSSYLHARLRDRKARIDSERATSSGTARRLRGTLERATLRAVRRYVPRPLRAPLDLFLPCRTWEESVRTQQGWRAAAADRFHVHYGPENGTPETMLREPDVAWLATALVERLQADERAPADESLGTEEGVPQARPAAVAAT